MEGETNKKPNGALWGAIIVILIIIVGGFFLIRGKVNQIKEEDAAEDLAIEQIINEANVLSSSDEFEDIEADLLKNSDLDVLDANLE